MLHFEDTYIAQEQNSIVPQKATVTIMRISDTPGLSCVCDDCRKAKKHCKSAEDKEYRHDNKRNCPMVIGTIQLRRVQHLREAAVLSSRLGKGRVASRALN